MTEHRRRPSKTVTERTQAEEGRIFSEIRRCLEEIIVLAGEGAGDTKAARSAECRTGSVRDLAEKALSLLGSFPCSFSVEGTREKKTPFSISSVCLSAAEKIAADTKTPPVTVEIDPSVPALVEGDSSGLEHRLEEIIGKASGAEGGKITLCAVARRNLPEGIEILFSAGGGKKAFSFAMTFSDVSPGEDQGEEKAPPLVLLAEDNPLSARIMESNLEALGFSVMKASDGKEALTLAEKHRFDIILMDIQMPEIDGLEATRALRRREKGTETRIPVLAVSASREEEDRKKCREAGMDGFLPKSSSLGEMAGILSSFLPRRVFRLPGEAAGGNPLLSATGGNREAAAEAAKIFLQTAPPLMAEMKRAVAHGDRILLASHAHRLKGNLVFFGAEKAVGLAQAMEEAAKGGALEGLPSLLYSLISEVNLLLADLRKEWLPI